MIDRYDVPHVYFILSATPRGGFSGGVAISEWGQVIGLITQSVSYTPQSILGPRTLAAEAAPTPPWHHLSTWRLDCSVIGM
jgi:hypothetical protein